MEKDRLLELRSLIHYMKDNNINEDTITKLDRLLNDNGIPLAFSKINPNSAAFNPNFGFISVNIKRLNTWLDNMVSYYSKAYDFKDLDLLRAYFVLYVYRHEIEHTNQYLYAIGKKEPNFEFKKDSFFNVYNVMIPKHYLVPRPITLGIEVTRFALYRKNAYMYILERNASIEGFDTTSLVALEDDDDICRAMIDSRNVHSIIGYSDDRNGCLYHTYKGMLMLRKYNKLDIPSDLSLTDRIREGLSIEEDERQMLLKHVKSSTRFK